jgi:hypothetical protein
MICMCSLCVEKMGRLEDVLCVSFLVISVLKVRACVALKYSLESSNVTLLPE